MSVHDQEQFSDSAKHLFLEARTHVHWLSRPIETARLRELYQLVSSGPTSMNSQPLRLKFAVSESAKLRLATCVNPGNVSKIRAAPVVAILGQDLAFPQHLPKLFPHKVDAQNYYAGQPNVIADTALRNSSLQGGYLIIAARLLGLDCGPMSGFDSPAVDLSFWNGTLTKTNFLCCLGYGDPTHLKPRLPRWSFDDVCEVL